MFEILGCILVGFSGKNPGEFKKKSFEEPVKEILRKFPEKLLRKAIEKFLGKSQIEVQNETVKKKTAGE